MPLKKEKLKFTVMLDRSVKENIDRIILLGATAPNIVEIGVEEIQKRMAIAKNRPI